MGHASTAMIGVRQVRYSTVAIVLHWLIAVLLVGEVALGLRMVGLHGSARFALFQLHKSIGITILLLVVLRLAWRLYRHPPAVGAHGWQRMLALGVHGLFYVLLFALPLSGWTIVSTSRIVVPTLLYGIVPWPHVPGVNGLSVALRDTWNAAAKFVHVNLVTVLYGLFALHLAGALKHQWLDRDGDLARMAPGVRPGRVADPRLLLIGLGLVAVVGLAQWAPVATSHAAVPPIVTIRPKAPPPAVAAPIAPIVTAAPPPSRAVATPVAAAVPSVDPVVATWAIQPGSTLHWRTTWSGDTIDGGFTRFGGTIVFAPDALDRSHVALTVETASVFSGDAQRDETLHGADWFATGSGAVATYSAERFRRVGPDRFVAAGRLRLKGVTLPVPVTFTLTIVGDTATMHGTASVDRTAFKIGEGEFAATTDLPAAVALDIAVTAKRQ